MRLRLFAAVAAACLVAPVVAPAAPAPIPPVSEASFPGRISLKVDATDLDHKIFKVEETIPVAGPGPLTLFYPQWLPGNHGPTGPVDKLAGLMISVGGQPVPWTRSSTNVHAFQLEVPAGVDHLDLSFEFLSPLDTTQGRVVMTPALLDLQWNTLVLYPAGYRASAIEVAPQVVLPAGWKFGTALEVEEAQGDATRFKPVSLEALVDSPMFAGRNFKRVAIGAMGGAPVNLDIVADKPEQLEAKPEQIELHKALVRQAEALFDGHHFNHYDFLFGLSDQMSGIGLEHHRSSEDGTTGGYFTEWDKNSGARARLPHEFTHSWDGKFRRPADLATPNYNTPMGDSLLWVYEGQTQYWGEVLTARSGLRSKEDELDALALIAATYDRRVGRAWRALQDTTNDPVAVMRRPEGWRSWQRSEDYYSEGLLVWLDADTLIRERTGGHRSLDDFARSFFGRDNGVWTVAPYTFEDVVATLNAVTPYDWASFLRERLDGHAKAPLDGLARGGYRLVYRDTPSNYQKITDAARKQADFAYSLGFVVGKEGKLADVQWDGIAYRAGLVPGDQLIAVNGDAYSDEGLKAAVKAAKGTTAPIELIVKIGDRYRVVRLDYHDGLRFPRLERDPGQRPRLDDILAPKE